MKIKDVLKYTQETRQEVLIGKEFFVIDKACLILGLGRCINEEAAIVNKLIVLHEDEMETESVWEDDFEEMEDVTVRQMLIDSMEEPGELSSSDIDQFLVNGREYDVLSAEFHYLSSEDFSDGLVLKHFADHGCIPARWQEKNVEELVLGEYEVDETINEINWAADILKIGATLQATAEQVLVGKVLEYEQGVFPQPHSFEIKGKAGEEIGVKVFSLKKVNSKEAEDYLALCEEDVDDIMEEGKQFLIVEYEADNGAEMQFFSKDYLDSYVDENSMDAWLGEGGSLAEISNQHAGKKFCVVDVVPDDFDGKVTLELLSYYED